MDQNFQPYSTPFSLYLKAKSPSIVSSASFSTLKKKETRELTHDEKYF